MTHKKICVTPESTCVVYSLLQFQHNWFTIWDEMVTSSHNLWDLTMLTAPALMAPIDSFNVDINTRVYYHTSRYNNKWMVANDCCLQIRIENDRTNTVWQGKAWIASHPVTMKEDLHKNLVDMKAILLECRNVVAHFIHSCFCMLWKNMGKSSHIC